LEGRGSAAGGGGEDEVHQADTDKRNLINRKGKEKSATPGGAISYSIGEPEEKTKREGRHRQKGGGLKRKLLCRKHTGILIRDRHRKGKEKEKGGNSAKVCQKYHVRLHAEKGSGTRTLSGRGIVTLGRFSTGIDPDLRT